MHLLHLEDSATDAELMGRLIHREWPQCRINHVATAAEYRAALETGGFDLILSDYTVPGFDGVAALALARARHPSTPFLFLSGTIGEERAVDALKRGASDYVLKDRPTRLIPAIQQALALKAEGERRRAVEAQLRRAQRMESIGTLAGGIAHDLNNVLTPIFFSLEMLATKATTPEEARLLEKTQASASHGAALLQQLLAFARGTDGHRTRLDAGWALCALQPLIRQGLPSSIALTVRHEAPPWPLQADLTEFNQALLNVCLNARDAMPQGGSIEIVTRNVMVDEALAAVNPGGRAGPHVRISVTDTGSGIPLAIIDKIFDPFFTTKPPGKGTGLGLSVVAGILKSHGGFVQLESEEGKGTTFHLLFPAEFEPAPVSRTEPPRSDMVPATTALGQAVLLVDDEPLVRETLQMLLRRAGYRVIAAEDGGDGLRQFAEHEPEIALVITDMMLPDQLGTEVVRALRLRKPELPIIAISGTMASGRFDELLRLRPAVQCLSKPLAPAILLAAIRRALGSAAVESVASAASVRM